MSKKACKFLLAGGVVLVLGAILKDFIVAFQATGGTMIAIGAILMMQDAK